ncbi:uncharacterized protein [Hemitrygon akajei]|uniref:uncharacterized protein n=1 Tax=Hemitrygon akajei TaxID=2704970 RepID=UPI003BF97840
MARLRAECKFSEKYSTPEELYFERTENLEKSIDLSRIEHDDPELQNMFDDSILPKSASSTTSVPKFAQLNSECFEEKLPLNPEKSQPSTIIDTDRKPGAGRWSASMSSKSTTFRGTMLSIIFEESVPTPTSDNEENCQSSMEETTTVKATKEHDSTPSSSLKHFSGKTEAARKTRSRSYSQKSSINFNSNFIEKSIIKRKNKRAKRLPTEQQTRIQEWTIRQLNNIEEASKHELVIEAE